jgi:hypothetical protein
MQYQDRDNIVKKKFDPALHRPLFPCSQPPWRRLPCPPPPPALISAAAAVRFACSHLGRRHPLLPSRPPPPPAPISAAAAVPDSPATPWALHPAPPPSPTRLRRPGPFIPRRRRPHLACAAAVPIRDAKEKVQGAYLRRVADRRRCPPPRRCSFLFARELGRIAREASGIARAKQR